MLSTLKSKYMVRIMILIIVILVSFSLNPIYTSPVESSEKAGFLILMPDEKWVKALSNERFFEERSKKYNVYIAYPAKKVISEIRKLIIDYKQMDENLKYLLIVGDYKNIPPYSFDKGYMGFKETFVTDYYYTDLIGKYPWEIHFPPDLSAGRIWAKDFNEAKEKLDAILDYESKPQLNYPLSFCGGFIPMFDDGWVLKDQSYLGEEMKKLTKGKIVTMYEVEGDKKTAFKPILPINIENVVDISTKSPITVIYDSNRYIWYDSNKNKKVDWDELIERQLITEDMVFNGITVLGYSFGGTVAKVQENFHQFSPIQICFTSDLIFVDTYWTLKSDCWLDTQLLYLLEGFLKNGSIGENISQQMVAFYYDFGCSTTSSTCFLRTIHYNLMGMQFFGDPTMELPDFRLSEIPKIEISEELDIGYKSKVECKIKNTGNLTLLCKIIESPSWIKLSFNECEIKPKDEVILTVELLTDYHSYDEFFDCQIPSKQLAGLINILTNDPHKPRFEIKVKAKVL